MTREQVLALALIFIAATVGADDFSSTLTVRFDVIPTHALDMVDVTAPLTYSKTFIWASGSGADQAQQMVTDSRSLTASTSESLDLAGSLSNGFGQTVTFTSVCAIYVEATSTNTGNLLVGGAAASAMSTWAADSSDKLVVRPGGCILLVARDATGLAVTAGTGDLLRVENLDTGAAATYKIVVIGRGSAS